MGFFDQYKEMSGALFSKCRKYRYLLYRVWDTSKPRLAVIGLNPSTADEKKNDPTVRRCIQFAKDWGYGGLNMLNIFAYRATDPRKMKQQKDPIGPDNNNTLERVCSKCGLVVAAWGTHGSYLDRGDAVMEILKGLKIYCFGTTNKGMPKHPLYIKKDVEIERYRGREHALAKWN